MAGYIARSPRGGLRHPRRWAGLGLCLALAACGGAHDEAGGLTKEDYEALKSRRPAAEAPAMAEPPIPDLAPVLAAPQPPLLADTRRVTLQATEVTPVKDLLIEIARQADIDLELDPRIEGGVIITARDRPLADVIERITDLAGLRYSLEDNRLRVEQDDPYLQTYRVDVLDVARRTSTSIASSTDVFSVVGDGGGGANASTTQVESEAEADFWGEITENITAIIEQDLPEPRTAGTPGPGVGVTDAAAAAAPAPAAAAAPAPTPEAGAGAEGVAEVDEGGAPGTTAVQEQATAAAAGISTADPGTATPPPVPTATEAEAGEAGTEEDEETGHYFTINRQAGVVSVYTTERQHEDIKDYLEQVRSNVGAQVLIEAKIVEVNLDEQFRAGIDWGLVAQGSNDFAVQGNFSNNVLPAGVTTPTLLASTNFGIGGAALNAVLQMVDEFGTTRTLSSPRLTVLNNHNAILKVAENEVYFTIEIDREVNEDGPDVITYDSDVHTVPVGVILNVQPSINRDTEEISLNLRPTISRIVRTVNDPAVALFAADIGNTNVQSPIPVVEVRELDSLVTMQSGDVLIMGGLMQERSENNDSGIPGVKDVPVVGAPFKQKIEDTEVIELVIFLRATIVNGRDSISPADRELYNKFTPDPRPIAF
ncbi:type II and III secretion system protein [Caenispirillum salinarum AK4]|uniref:Type II and III secretion system protein n=1 Tax=Caenispirillum salinarum AK4 TaxID=1238182 RepID=K9GIW2_9PROT|nr:pilus (MSHA type) biogenesis protein MshL [Caenispirillum salinarum]EKV25920.1 type II and III secretion system protein [Caenispirillum salinarum AK4]